MPFYWIGALVSLAFLTIVISIFGLLLKIGNRAATEMRDSILPGLVEGIRDWADDHERPAVPGISPRADEGVPPLEVTPPAPELRLEHVRRAR